MAKHSAPCGARHPRCADHTRLRGSLSSRCQRRMRGSSRAWLRADGLRLLGGTLGNACTMQSTAIKIKQAQDLAQGAICTVTVCVRWAALRARALFMGSRMSCTTWASPSVSSEAHGFQQATVRMGRMLCAHTAATWLMQAGVDAFEAAGYLGMSVERLLEVEGHHHPAFQEKAVTATSRSSSANLRRVG
jgi:hypothetical protein